MSSRFNKWKRGGGEGGNDEKADNLPHSLYVIKKLIAIDRSFIALRETNMNGCLTSQNTREEFGKCGETMLSQELQGMTST